MSTHRQRSNEQCLHNQGTCLLFNASSYQYSRSDLDQICYELTSDGIGSKSVVWNLYSSSSGLSCFAVLLPQTDDRPISVQHGKRNCTNNSFLSPVSDSLPPYHFTNHCQCIVGYHRSGISTAESLCKGLHVGNRSRKKVLTNAICPPEKDSYVFTDGMIYDRDIVVPERYQTLPLDCSHGYKHHQSIDTLCRCLLGRSSDRCMYNSVSPSSNLITTIDSEVTHRNAIEEKKGHSKFAIEHVLQQLALLTSNASCTTSDVISQSDDTLYDFCVANAKSNEMPMGTFEKSCTLTDTSLMMGTLDDLRRRDQQRDSSWKQKSFNTEVSESTDLSFSFAHSLHCSASCSLSSCYSSVWGVMKNRKAITLGLRLDKVTKRVFPCYKVYSITDERLLPAGVMEAKLKGKTSQITIREVINEYLRELEKFGKYQKIGRNCSDFAAAFINLMSHKNEEHGRLTGRKLMCEACQRWVCRCCC